MGRAKRETKRKRETDKEIEQRPKVSKKDGEKIDTYADEDFPEKVLIFHVS